MRTSCEVEKQDVTFFEKKVTKKTSRPAGVGPAAAAARRLSADFVANPVQVYSSGNPGRFSNVAVSFAIRAAMASLIAAVFQIAACTQAARSSDSATPWSRA